MKSLRWLQIVVPAIAALALPLLLAPASQAHSQDVVKEKPAITWYASLRADAWK